MPCCNCGCDPCTCCSPPETTQNINNMQILASRVWQGDVENLPGPGGTRVANLPYVPAGDYTVLVWADGVIQRLDDDYTLDVTGQLITFVNPFPDDAVIYIAMITSEEVT